ncbi:MAG: adenosylcobinamide-GDP ribazoletransferase [Candidatus Dormibacteria bacterium]
MRARAASPLRGAFAAVGFLTLIPIPAGRDEEIRLGRIWFPLVGAAVGLVAGAVDWGLTPLVGPGPGAVAAMGTLALITGGLHLDGLSDSADGLFGGHTRELRLEIMRDSRAGAFGVVALILLLLGQFSTLATLSHGRVVLALVVAGAASRWFALCVLVALPYARSEGLGVAWRERRRLLDVGIGTVLVVPFVWWGGLNALIGVALAALGATGVSLLAMRRVGGATGDVYGAVVEICQVLVLVGFVVRV